MKSLLKAFLVGVLVAITFTFKLNLFIMPFKIRTFSSINSILAMILFLIAVKIFKKDDVRINKIKQVGSFIIAFLFLLGDIYQSIGSIIPIFENILVFSLSIIKLFGYYYVIKAFFFYLDLFLCRKDICFKFRNKYVIKFVELFDKYPFRTSLITILLFWSIYLIAFYPGVLSPDPYFQILQYFNCHTKYIDWVIQRNPLVFMTTHHPVFQTYFIGMSLEFGRIFVSDNFGLFIYILIQTLVFSCVLSYSIKVLKSNKIKLSYRIILLLIYLLVPSYAFYSISFVKDTYYTIFMILFVLFIYDIIKHNKVMNYKDILYLSLICLLICLFRHNGSVVIILSLLILIIYNKGNRIKLFASFSIFFIMFFSFNNILVPYLGISSGSVREALSVPFQQTARYVKYYDDEISEDDKKVIDKVLNYDSLALRYKEEIADPVKNEFNKYTTKEDLKDYFIVWFKGLIKHPVCYIDAFLENTYGYFYPNKHNWYIYSSITSKYEDTGIFKYNFNNMYFLRGILSGYGNIFPYLPLLGLLVNIGFSGIWLGILSIYLISNKKYKFLIVLVPLYLSLLICFVSPVNAYFRYAMPYIFVLPVLTILLKKELKQ